MIESAAEMIQHSLSLRDTRGRDISKKGQPQFDFNVFHSMWGGKTIHLNFPLKICCSICYRKLRAVHEVSRNSFKGGYGQMGQIFGNGLFMLVPKPMTTSIDPVF